jgi:hypothetical protein
MTLSIQPDCCSILKTTLAGRSCAVMQALAVLHSQPHCLACSAAELRRLPFACFPRLTTRLQSLPAAIKRTRHYAIEGCSSVTSEHYPHSAVSRELQCTTARRLGRSRPSSCPCSNPRLHALSRHHPHHLATPSSAADNVAWGNFCWVLLHLCFIFIPSDHSPVCPVHPAGTL